MESILHGALYNAIEVTLIAIIGTVHFFGGEMWTPVLWLMFAASAVWTLLASTHDAQDEAKLLIESEVIYVTDFIAGAILMVALAGMVVQYGLGYGVILLVAAVQNLRYSAMAYDWKVNYDRRERDNLP
jgi:hypothetical protein